MKQQACGTFEVKLEPLPMDDALGGVIGRLAINKTFSGDLEATSVGQMLASGSAQVKGSAGYVAIERVTGRLHGRTGTFVLQHTGTMNRGAPSLTVSVVPDTGTDELTSLSGSMTIDISSGNHAYTFDYKLDD